MVNSCDLRGPGLPSLKLNVEANIPNGNAPIPKDMWNPPSPNPNPGKPWKDKTAEAQKIVFVNKLLHVLKKFSTHVKDRKNKNLYFIYRIPTKFTHMRDNRQNTENILLEYYINVDMLSYIKVNGDPSPLMLSSECCYFKYCPCDLPK